VAVKLHLRYSPLGTVDYFLGERVSEDSQNWKIFIGDFFNPANTYGKHP
jgi:hypothetical protein